MRTKRRALRAPLTCVLIAVTACDPRTQVAPRSAAVLVVVNGDPGERVEGAEIYAGSTLVARTEARGVAELAVSGLEGESFELRVRCPPGYRSPVSPLRVRRLDITSSAALPEYAVTCARTRHEMVIAIRAEGGPNLPLLYLGKEVARTDAAGAAHVALDMNVDDKVELVLATPGAQNEKLHPQNPSALFEMHEADDVQVFAVTFTRDRKKAVVKAAPSGPVQF